MLAAGNAFLFGDYRIATASSGRSSYGHTFGGPHERKGTSRKECKGVLIHLLHRLDLSDPAIPIAIPGVRWLPFYFCFNLHVRNFGYRLISEEMLATYLPDDVPNVADRDAFPTKEFPIEFPRSNIKIGAYAYDPTKLEDAEEWSGVFGIGKLSKADQSVLKKGIAKMTRLTGRPTPKIDSEFEDYLTSPFYQGKYDFTCLNPDCPNHTRKRPLRTIAMMSAEPVEGLLTMGPDAEVQFIYQICGKCNAIRVSDEVPS